MSDANKKRGSDSGFDRRAFLKGSGAAAAVTAVQAGSVAAQDSSGKDVQSGWKKIELNVNDEVVTVNVEPRTTLLEVLRYQLDLTGAKPVSLDGSSGASTVLIGGKPKMASTTLAISCRRKKIETVESLGGENPDAVPQAFVDNDALQCGFCTAGFVVAVRAFLNKNPDASEAEIRAGLNGNICRCGTYVGIIDAAISVAKGGK
jgi:xanthine dehydrogenase YagT iron-sulfur-binding subunit|tara:strand:- start:629 stop:1240 length:612 start_codon:yes stop_codon:yes gene_type:complete